MERDISNNVVAILLVLTIIVSAAGTWAFLTSFEAVSVPTTHEQTNSKAAVLLSITDGEAQSDSGAGQIRLQVTPLEGT